MMDIIKSKLNQYQEWIKEEINYFSLSTQEQALFLENKKRYRRARDKYVQLNNWPKAIEISKLLEDYENIFNYQVKNEEWEQALHTVELYELYHLGAPLCVERGLLNKAAHMYSFFDRIKAASLYKQLGLWDKAAESYLLTEQYFRALDCLDNLKDIEKKIQGYKNIEMKTDELFAKKQYEKALKLYIRMELWEKALQISQILNYTDISSQIYEQLAQLALNAGELLKAASFLEQIHVPEAIHLYLEIGYIEDAARLLINMNKKEEALQLFLEYKYIDKAEKLAEKEDLYDILLSYYKQSTNIEKIYEIYEKLEKFEEAALYFIEQKRNDLALLCTKKIVDKSKAVLLLEQMEEWEMAAHYYLALNRPDLCEICLHKSGFNPQQIKEFIKIKNYPDSFSL